MGNFSRNTFKPEKNYVGVRLQQGVPLVDADWNELNDVGRQDLYNGLSAGFGDGVARNPADPSGFAFRVAPAGGTQNDFSVRTGGAIVGGRPVQLPVTWLRYAQQPWTNAAKAAQDGVAVIPPLTTPGAARSDLVYMDVWEREVGKAEDSEIVNPVIGVETAVRLKREVAIRVVEGSTTMPNAPAGHRFMRLAILNRPAGQAEIGSAEIEDRRPVLDSGPAERPLSILPVFQEMTGLGTAPWQFALQDNYNIHARKPLSVDAGGYIPLALPQGAQLTKLQLRGLTSGTMGSFVYTVFVSWADISTAGAPGWTMFIEQVTTIGAFNRITVIPASTPGSPQLHIVDNTRYSYWLYAYASGSSLEVAINGVVLSYLI